MFNRDPPADKTEKFPQLYRKKVRTDQFSRRPYLQSVLRGSERLVACDWRVSGTHEAKIPQSSVYGTRNVEEFPNNNVLKFIECT